MNSKPTMRIMAPTLAAIMLIAAACAGNTSTTNSTAASAPTAAAEATATEPAAEAATAEEATTEPAATAADTEATTEPTAAAAEEATEPVAAVAMTKLNLNTVTGDELLNTIPGFGDRMVREFQEYRPYISIQQFRREIGKYVDDAQVADYEQYVYVPVDVNESDAETLKQLPGVDDAIAEELMAARPYDSNDAFLAKLAELVSPEDAAAASGYLAQ
ncbi:MAG: hypothetical protein KDE46_21185 [Caldilineaceae bacterium]|nr:hypothetical protein [Caldilineaceae bacterium]